MFSYLNNLVILLLIVLATATSNAHAACKLANIAGTEITASFVDRQMNSGENVISGVLDALMVMRVSTTL
jgi:hypothetical protein